MKARRLAIYYSVGLLSRREFIRWLNALFYAQQHGYEL